MSETLVQLFDTYVASILNYRCEVWCSHNAKDLEKIQLEIIKSVPGARGNTNFAMVYFETWRLLMEIIRYFRMFQFWLKVSNSENCILRNCCDGLYYKCDRMKNCRKKNWAYCIKEKLHGIGLGYILV
jgi:hypothetical protein